MIGSSTIISAPPNVPLGIARTLPPRSNVASRTIVRPKPVQLGLVVYPGSQIFLSAIPTIPGPLSATLTERMFS